VTGIGRKLDRSQQSTNNGGVAFNPSQSVMTIVNQAEILIALVVAAHAGVLAVRLCFSLYKA
jgi:photosystem I subunit 12